VFLVESAGAVTHVKLVTVKTSDPAALHGKTKDEFPSRDGAEWEKEATPRLSTRFTARDAPETHSETTSSAKKEAIRSKEPCGALAAIFPSSAHP
jgi:hypothetical protein